MFLSSTFGLMELQLFWLFPDPQYTSASFPDSKPTSHLTLALSTVLDLRIPIPASGKSKETVRPVKWEYHQYLTVTLKGAPGAWAKGDVTKLRWNS